MESLFKLLFMKTCILLLSGCLAIGIYAKAQTTEASKPSQKIIRTYDQYARLVKRQPDQLLIDLSAYIRAVDIRMPYAGTDNFTHQKLYPFAKAFLKVHAASALRAAANDLISKGYGLIIYDAYRPYSVTRRMWKFEPDADYAANPKTGSDHNRGIAVDIGLYSLKSRQDVAMPSTFDSFSDSAHIDYNALPDSVIANRSLLQQVMMAHGFKPLRTEWWHFSLQDTVSYPLMDVSFETVEKELRH